jgi:protein involved in polysaccharide export with SLBB domain
MGVTRKRIGLVVLFVVLMRTTGIAQTTIITPEPEAGSCDTGDCATTARKVDATGVVRNVPSRVWQVDDAAQEQNDQKKARSIRGEKAEWRRFSPAYPEAEVQTEFQQLVERSSGRPVPIYGLDFFRNSVKSKARYVRVPVPADYVLAAGDHLLIHLWGQVDFNARVIVDRNGQIYLPKLGMITVAGVRYDKLHDYLKNNISRSFKNFDLSVSLGQMRLISVTLAGRARHPGRYGFSSQTTLVNALTYSGGPTANGSMRHIQLKRNGAVIAEFDAYDLLVNGNNANDKVLSSGDVIYIPPVGPQVAVLGSVNQPGIYELKGPTIVGQQIEAAGGLNATADTSRATIETIENQTRKVESLALDETGKQQVLRDGDILHVFPVSPRFENAVTLRGNVARPGRYPWRPGMKVQDLIPSRDRLITGEFWVAQDSMGQPPPGWLDHSESKSRTDSAGHGHDQVRDVEASTGPEGTRGNPRWGTDELPAKIRNLAEINWDYAVVQRLDSSNLSTKLLPFNLGRALENPGGPDNLALEAGDVVTVFSQRDLSVPTENRTKFVRVEGEVKAAGIYRAEPGETLRQIVARAGGLTPDAYLFASVFERQSTRREQQKELDHLLNDMEQEMRAKTARLASIGSVQDHAEGRGELELERSMIEKLRQSPVSGRIVLDLKSSDTNLDSLPALSLEDGDRIIVPPRPDTVDVVGAVYNQGAFIYREGKSMRNYLTQSGGPTRNADAGRIFIIRADGSVLSKQMHHGLWGGSLESLKLAPGDTIVVPERVRASNLLRGIRDWSQVFAQFALGAAAVRVVAP